MTSFFFYLCIILLKLILKHQVYSIPTCIIVDTNMIKRTQDETTSLNNRSLTSSILRNLRALNHQHTPDTSDYVVEPIPLSYIDLKQSQSSPLVDIDYSSLKKSLIDSTIDRTLSPCSLKLLNVLETQMVFPFEFRRLRVEQPDHRIKFLDDDPRETVPDLATAIYERRSDPDGVRFCRTCRDGRWTELTVCEIVRCDAELLRANPRLVSAWGEIKSIDGGALYAPSSVFAIYAFAFGPHCKRCETNGQWSRYALAELCSGIQFLGNSLSSKIKTTVGVRKVMTTSIASTLTTTTTIKTTTAAAAAEATTMMTEKLALVNNVIPKMRANTTTYANSFVNDRT